MRQISTAVRLQEVPASQLLSTLAEPPRRHAHFTKEGKASPVEELIKQAEYEFDEAGITGLTVSLKEVRVLDAHDDWSWDARGEIYVVTSLIDGSGTQPDFSTKRFDAIKSREKLPLGEGGMLIGTVRNPKWFLDMHTLVMESDSEVRNLGDKVKKAREQSGLKELLEKIGGLTAFDPTQVSKVAFLVDAFVSILAGFLAEDGDDHVATIHDFYLKSQGFGLGRHPQSGRMRFQATEVAYQIDVEEIT